MSEDIRWQQRFDNFKGALATLKRNLNLEPSEEYREAVDMATAQSFEMVFELTWKLLKDYMEQNQVEIENYFNKRIENDI